MANLPSNATVAATIVPRWLIAAARPFTSHPLAIVAAGIGFQVVVLVAMVMVQSAPTLYGERILLRVRPVDPRDLFRGDYVVLSYDLNRVEPDQIPGLAISQIWRGSSLDGAMNPSDRTVYVTLEPDTDGKHYHAAAYSTERPNSGLFLKGRYAPSQSGNVSFGIESFFVQEGQGKVLEKLRNENNLSAEIAVTPWGQASVVDVKEMPPTAK